MILLDIKISVIIPVYNGSLFLERCLDSVLAQTLSDIEVICIDDFSCDNSLEILKRYALQDTRLKYFVNEKNIGQGLTRNKGIDLASGKYIAFVDCDDWIENIMYERLYEKAVEYDYDLVCCNIVHDFPDGTSQSPIIPEIESLSLEFLIGEAIFPTDKLFSPNSPCDKIYKKEFIDKLELRFESERVFLYEDKFFNLSLLVAKPNFSYVPEVFYHYVIRHGSTMISYKKDFTNRYFAMNERIVNLLIKNQLMSDELDLRLKKSLFDIIFTFCLNALVYNKKITGKIIDFSDILRDKRISDNAKCFDLKDIPSSSSSINSFVKSVCFLILKYFK